jgi:hypothetical protein
MRVEIVPGRNQEVDKIGKRRDPKGRFAVLYHFYDPYRHRHEDLYLRFRVRRGSPVSAQVANIVEGAGHEEHTVSHGRCSCPGYYYHGHCYHLAVFKAALEVSPETWRDKLRRLFKR